MIAKQWQKRRTIHTSHVTRSIRWNSSCERGLKRCIIGFEGSLNQEYSSQRLSEPIYGMLKRMNLLSLNNKQCSL